MPITSKKRTTLKARNKRRTPGATFNLFLSHSSKQKALASDLKDALANYGITAFVAHEDIRPTTQWLEKIRSELAACDALAALLSEDFKTSDYCDQEVGHALQRDILVIAVRIKRDPHGFMAPDQGIAAFSKEPPEIAKAIREVLLHDPRTTDRMKRADKKGIENLVKRFLASDNYGTSTTLLREIEDRDKIPKRLITRIKNEWETNDQISGCNGIPSRINALLRRHGQHP